jgi:hypothetical protein
MTQTAQTKLNLTYPLPSDLFKRGSQNYRLYERMLAAPITNEEIADKEGLHIRSHTRRISDLREKLKPRSFDVKAERVSNTGLYSYRLIPYANTSSGN